MSDDTNKNAFLTNINLHKTHKLQNNLILPKHQKQETKTFRKSTKPINQEKEISTIVTENRNLNRIVLLLT